jgi:hypothetical protein
VLFALMADQREEIRKTLADDLGGTPEDYDAQADLTDLAGESVTDGGD